MRALKVGETAIVNGHAVKCVINEKGNCEGCAFKGENRCSAPKGLNCLPTCRKDRKFVQFVQTD